MARRLVESDPGSDPDPEPDEHPLQASLDFALISRAYLFLHQRHDLAAQMTVIIEAMRSEIAAAERLQ